MIRDILKKLAYEYHYLGQTYEYHYLDQTLEEPISFDKVDLALSEIKKEVLGAIPKTISDKVIMGYGNMDSKLEVEARNDAITDTRKALEGVFK